MLEVPPPDYDKEEMENISDTVNASVDVITDAVDRVVERIMANPVQTMAGLSDDDRASLIDAQREMASLLSQCLVTITTQDEQYQKLMAQQHAQLEAHNRLVQHLNQTVLSEKWLSSVIDTRVVEVEQTRHREQIIAEIHSKLSLVRLGESTVRGPEHTCYAELEPGQYIVYNVYPDDPTKYSVDELDSVSYNVAKVAQYTESDDGTAETTYSAISRKEQPELFAALALKFSEDYVSKVTANEVVPTNIKDRHGKDYTLLLHYGVYEIQGTSVELLN